MGLWRLTLTANSHTHIHTPCMYVCMCVCMRVCVYVCMHITAFASILSLALEIEVLSFAVNVARYKHLFQKVWQGLFSLGSKTFLYTTEATIENDLIRLRSVTTVVWDQFTIELDWKFTLSLTPLLACS